MTLATVRSTFGLLTENHYLGPIKAASFAWRDADGAMVFSAPRGRHVKVGWLELTRWCLTGGPNAGSRQWARFVQFARASLPATTVVSYSDPSRGHTGALYRACGWLWAPTWHRLRPPPSGNGAWTDGKIQAVKDRWVYPLRPDESRRAALALQDDTLRRVMPWAQYREPTWRRGVPHLDTGGGDFGRFAREIGLAGWRGTKSEAEAALGKFGEIPNG